MTTEFETDIMRTVWNNGTGSKVVIKPDGDGLDLVELFDEENNRFVLYPEQARLVAAALIACADEIRPNTDVSP